MKLLLRNRMAAVGLFIIFASAFVALETPLITPYTPTQVVSGAVSQPEWVMLFRDGYYLSKNVLAVDDPLFATPAAVPSWQVTASSSTQASLMLSYSGNAAPGTRGSLQMAYLGTGPGNVSLTRTFHYPYHGPPQRFFGSVYVMASGASQAQPVHVTLFVSQAGGTTFNLWTHDLTSSGAWTQPEYDIDSNNVDLQSAIGIGGAGFGLPAVIFPAVQDYTFGVNVAFTGNQQVNISNIQLKLLGTAWGLLGTDRLGSDLLTQDMYASRISLLVGLTASAIGIGLGLIVGLLAGFLGALVDESLMRFTDMMLVIPTLPLYLVLVTVLGASIINIIIIIGFFAWMGFARIIRSQVLTLKERPFIEAARAAGAGKMKILSSHVFPNIIGLTYVNLALTVPAAILSEAALAFLGLFDPTVISWGHILFNAEESGDLFVWYWVIPPGLAIAIVSLSFILIGYAMDELFNPRLRRRR
jgi:peptide/nickel transport system permease protein